MARAAAKSGSERSERVERTTEKSDAKKAQPVVREKEIRPSTPSTPNASNAPSVGPLLPFRMWKDGTRRGIVYVEGRENAEKILVATGKRKLENPDVVALTAKRKGDTEAFLEGTMAVYSDRRGRPFAWQIQFDIGRWDVVTALMSEAA